MAPEPPGNRPDRLYALARSRVSVGGVEVITFPSTCNSNWLGRKFVMDARYPQTAVVWRSSVSDIDVPRVVQPGSDGQVATMKPFSLVVRMSSFMSLQFLPGAAPQMGLHLYFLSDTKTGELRKFGSGERIGYNRMSHRDRTRSLGGSRLGRGGLAILARPMWGRGSANGSGA